jgi:ADP-ribose pyrophosphatase YjhB (NUDIX family)
MDGKTETYYEHDAPYDEWLQWWKHDARPKFEHPDVTVDCLVVTYDESARPDESLKALIVQRWTHPFKNQWSLPGTFLHADDENALGAIERMLVERFNVHSNIGFMQQLQTFTGLHRDPRGQIVSIAHILYVRDGVSIIHGIDGVRWVPIHELSNMELAFDHNDIADIAINRMQEQFGWTPNVFCVLPSPFTLTEAIRLRSSLFDEDMKSINRANFKKKYQPMWNTAGVQDPSDPRSPKLFTFLDKE